MYSKLLLKEFEEDMLRRSADYLQVAQNAKRIRSASAGRVRTGRSSLQMASTRKMAPAGKSAAPDVTPDAVEAGRDLLLHGTLLEAELLTQLADATLTSTFSHPTHRSHAHGARSLPRQELPPPPNCRCSQCLHFANRNVAHLVDQWATLWKRAFDRHLALSEAITTVEEVFFVRASYKFTCNVHFVIQPFIICSNM